MNYFKNQDEKLIAVGRMVERFSELKAHLATCADDMESRQELQRLANNLSVLLGGELLLAGRY